MANLVNADRRCEQPVFFGELPLRTLLIWTAFLAPAAVFLSSSTDSGVNLQLITQPSYRLTSGQLKSPPMVEYASPSQVLELGLREMRHKLTFTWRRSFMRQRVSG